MGLFQYFITQEHIFKFIQLLIMSVISFITNATDIILGISDYERTGNEDNGFINDS